MTSKWDRGSLFSQSSTTAHVMRVKRDTSIAVITLASWGEAVRVLSSHRIYTKEIFVGWGGGLSEHVVVPRKAVFEIPDSVSMDIAGKAVNPS